MADRVPPSAWAVFHSGLLIAKESLLRAAEQDPEDPTPYSYLAGPIAKGLQLDSDQTVEWFTVAITKDPLNCKARFGRMSTLCKKWGGSHEAMFAFARGTTKACPKNSRLGSILLHAFYERWLYLKNFERRQRTAKDYLRSPKMRDEALAIYKRCFEGQEISEISDVGVHTTVARFLLVAGFEAEANRELCKLKPWKVILPQNDIVSATLRLPRPEVAVHFLAQDLRS